MRRHKMEGKWPKAPDRGMLRDHKGWHTEILVGALMA